MALAIVGCVIGGVSVAAASEPRADVTVNALSSAWDQPAVDIETGDTVTWNLNSGGAAHNVAATDGPPEDPQWRQVKTPIVTSGEVGYTFTQPGTYSYLCEVHAATMTGTVTVTGEPTTPTPGGGTPSQTPTPSPTASPRPTVSATPDHTTPPPTRLAAGDTSAPVLSRLRLKAIRRGAKVSFALSESARVTIRVKRGKSTKRTVRLWARAGTRAVNVRGSSLVRGRYAVEVEARDARGNRAAMQRANVRVKR